MDTVTEYRESSSIVDLITELREETKTFIKQEIKLAKTEITEKMSAMGKHLAFIAAGGLVAYTGAILILSGFALLLARLFENTGMSRVTAGFLGFGILGLLVAAGGYFLLRKGMKCLSQDSLAPDKSIEAIKGEIAVPIKQVKSERKASSSELKTEIEATKIMMDETVSELRDRFTPRRMAQSVKMQVFSHPVRSAVFSLGAGSAIFFYLKKKFGRNGAAT